MSELDNSTQQPRRVFKIIVFLIPTIFIGLTLYLVYSAVQVQYHLSRVKNEIQQANLNGTTNGADAADLLSNVRTEISAAQNNTKGPVWWLAAHVPYLGRTPNAIRTAVATLNYTLVHTNELEEKLNAGGTEDSFGNFKFVLGLSDSLVLLETPIKNGANNLSALRLSGVPSVVAKPVAQLASGYSALVPITADAHLFSQVAPSLLGLDHPRKWMLVFQNGAEARSVGGFPGGWGILTASAGKLSLSKIYKETALMNPPLRNYRSYVSAEQADLYGSDLSRISDLNLSPDFPTNARLMVAIEEQNFGAKVSGVISMNEQALANLMKVTGSVTVHGKEIAADEAADYITKGVYADYPDPKKKDAAVFLIIEKTFAKFQSGSVSPVKMLQAFIPAIHDNNLHAWSNEPITQRKLAKTPLSGSMSNVNSPTAAVVFINGAGNKLDAYIHPKVVYDQGVCESDFPYRDASMEISLQNQAPTEGLPKYVTTRYDLGTLNPANPGATKMIVYVHVPFGSVFESATINGEETPLLTEGVDLGRSVYRFDVELPAKSTQQLSVKFAEPAIGNEAPPSLWTQHMPNSVKAKVIAGLGCN